MSLGEGRILSHVGEPFSANITLLGSYNKDVSFSQVRSTECRASIIGKTGCESLYDSQLSISLKRRPDGQYFLRVTGEKNDEFYYHILIKSSSPDDGSVFKTYEFLPEFTANSDVQSVAENEADVLPSGGKYGVVGGKVIEVAPNDERMPSKAVIWEAPIKGRQPVAIRQKHRPIEAAVKKPLQTSLQIKKSGEYADDIHALQKENGEIEEQIALLEKHIGLLKEVIQLKTQADASSVSEVAAVSSVPAKKPVAVQAQSPQANDEPGMLTWILLTAVLVLAALLGWMYKKMMSLNLKGSPAELMSADSRPSSLNEMKPLDLTSSFVKPKW